jgi:hypothetical protein
MALDCGTVASKVQTDEIQHEKTNLDKYTPAMATIMGALIAAFIGFIISSKTITSNQKNLDKQLQNAKEIMELQLRHAKEISEEQIRTQLIIHREKEWISSIRTELATFLSEAHYIYHDIIGAISVPPDKLQEANRKMVNSQAMLNVWLYEEDVDQKKVLEIVEKISLAATTKNDTSEPKFASMVYELLTSSRRVFAKAQVI